MAVNLELASCAVGDHHFGIEVAQVQEVARGGHLTRLPLAPRAVCGLLNLRGQVLPVIDLRTCLELAEREAGQIPVHVILKTDTGSVSLLVDSVGDVFTVNEADFQPVPGTMRGGARQLVSGAYAQQDGLLLALDTSSVLALMAETPASGEL
jgi:purine-binding chemotaxis protein CheW